MNAVSALFLAVASSAVLALQSSQPSSIGPEIVTIASGSRMLRGVMWRPAGEGPFPAILFNHGRYGYNGCRGFIPSNCDPAVPQKILTLDTRSMTSVFKPGIVIPLKPFFGSMGVAPAPELGRVSSNPPGRHAGNLDNRELGVGSTLYIPVFVRGALFEIGDGHAAQGDGEVDQTAIGAGQSIVE